MQPEIDTKTDGHVHTRLCHHARGEMEDYVRAALARGLKKLIFLEHLETEINYFESTWLKDRDFAYYFQEGKRLQDKYKGRLEIGLGVEAGYNPDHRDAILKRLAAHEWDRIGISYHFMKHKDCHLNLLSRKQANITALAGLGVNRVLTSYFSVLKEAVENLPGDTLCHFDAALRHLPDVQLTAEHHHLIDELLDSVARKGLAVEVNTSGYPLRGMPYPAPALIKKTIERGIPLVAGSDAHKPEDVGRFFDQLAELVEQLKINTTRKHLN